MSTELQDVTPTILQTRFWGGKEKGSCLQITQTDQETPWGVMPQNLKLTKEEASKLATALLLFATDNEVEKFDD
jgi:hypothetical protein